MAKDPAAVSLGRRGGKKGGPARMAALSAAERSALARKGARARWAEQHRLTAERAEAAARAELRRWLRKPSAERIRAVETIRNETIAWYFPGAPERLERVFRFVGEAPRPLPARRRARARRPR